MNAKHNPVQHLDVWAIFWYFVLCGFNNICHPKMTFSLMRLDGCLFSCAYKIEHISVCLTPVYFYTLM